MASTPTTASRAPAPGTATHAAPSLPKENTPATCKVASHKARQSERTAKKKLSAPNKCKAGKMWTWKKRSADRPKRPLSAYNLFFQSEREKVSKQQTATSIGGGGGGEKRTFAGMTRVIASRWNELDADAKAEFETRAALDRERHEREMKLWKATARIKELEEKKAEMDKELTKLKEEIKDLDEQQEGSNPSQDENDTLSPDDTTTCSAHPMPASCSPSSISLEGSKSMSANDAMSLVKLLNKVNEDSLMDLDGQGNSSQQQGTKHTATPERPPSDSKAAHVPSASIELDAQCAKQLQRRYSAIAAIPLLDLLGNENDDSLFSSEFQSTLTDPVASFQW